MLIYITLHYVHPGQDRDNRLLEESEGVGRKDSWGSEGGGGG